MLTKAKPTDKEALHIPSVIYTAMKFVVLTFVIDPNLETVRINVYSAREQAASHKAPSFFLCIWRMSAWTWVAGTERHSTAISE